MTQPTVEQAFQLALLLQSGMPSSDAIRYFIPADEPVINEASLRVIHDSWMRSSALKRAMVEVQGRPWQELDFETRIKRGVEKHYTELAYFLYSRNFCEASGAELTKMNTARTALEAKLAGLAGSQDALSRFWSDVTTGKVKLTPVAAPLTVLPA